MIKHADYVIVGAGSAGCILAARLSEDPTASVALLEAGGRDTDPLIWRSDIGAVTQLAAGSSEDWGYSTVEQGGLAGRSIPIARGKVLGGCSAINAMIYIRGNRRDFDSWQALGNRGWSYDEVLPYFKKSERFHGPDSAFHGRDGPVSVIEYRKPSAVSHAFIEASAELGYAQKYNDFNGADQAAGAGFYQSTRTPDGIRVSSASAFLKPNSARKNLQLYTDTRVTRVLWQGTRAVGVEYEQGGRRESLRAEREVILCGGAFETPKLLMLSGVGPAEALARHDIPLVQHLAGVGQNLRDHLMLGVAFACKTPVEPPELLAEAGLFCWSATASRQGSPDLQYFFGPLQFVTPDYRTTEPSFTFAPILLQPQSRGSVTLVSRDPNALARINPAYLSREADVEVLQYGIRWARDLAHARAFAGSRGREIAPGARVTTAGELRDYIQKAATTVWHPCGTCSMGSGPDAVVDDQLRVHGVDGLRIADASILPRAVAGNPNASVMMIAEKAADLLAAMRAEQALPERRQYPAEVWTQVASEGFPSPSTNGRMATTEGVTNMPSAEMSRRPPELSFVASVSLRFDTPTAVGETPDGVRFDFNVHGTVEGPRLNGKFEPCAAYLLIDPDGIGTINVRAPLFISDGAMAELEATGRYDFGKDGYRRAVAKDLPNSALGWCPRLSTGDSRYLWLNRVMCLGLGELRPREASVTYDLFIVNMPTVTTNARPATRPDWSYGDSSAASSAQQNSLYERLGSRPGIYNLMSASIDSLHNNEQLNRQNPTLGSLRGKTNAADLKEKVTDYICKLAGGPCTYKGRTLRASHAPLNITEADWRVFVDDFVRVMTDYGIRSGEQEELLALMAGTKGDILKPQASRFTM